MSRYVKLPIAIGTMANYSPPPSASRRSSFSQSYVPSRRMSKSPLFLPSPFKTYPSQPHPRQRDRDRDHDLLDIISVNSFSPPSPLPPLRPSPCKTRKRRRQGHLIMDNSDPKELRIRSRSPLETGIPAPSTGPSEKKTKWAAKEMAAVMDDGDNKVEEKDKSEIPTLLDRRSLQHSHTIQRFLTWQRRHRCWRRPVAASTSWRRRETHVLTSSNSASVKVSTCCRQNALTCACADSAKLEQ
ncbi:hypothetical protein H4582DRAFT_1967521 [Lactarius indigo]|nr:hypothetical protein H4582DRAFT_1967521 [Lactarius indigo]